ncbi:hypothetical protein NDU88_005566 [Pleurodeles waltl]|uniref:Uncharacterized protein n=1 Tax=Pleurodeles waltl TaxID=8319 RepID=A0AAV7PFX8_PLEWA|nr:hypothetical protein NDU88_005566 [Pleurodeles waltl]
MPALPFSWRFPPFSLLDSVFPGELATTITDFFQINKGSVANVGIVWETFNVYIRGITIAKHAGVLRSIRGRLHLLEREISQLEQDHQVTADAHILGHINNKIQEFQEMALSEVQHLGKYATARLYGEGDRPGGVLAGLIRPNRDKNTITVIKAGDGSELRDPERIADKFRDYYQSLYTSRVDTDLEALMDYLIHITMPQLTDADREALWKPLTLSEMAMALGGWPKRFLMKGTINKVWAYHYKGHENNRFKACATGEEQM